MGQVIKDRKELIAIIDKIKSNGETVVFTNGCFDILHAGHVDYLNKAKSFGNYLIVAVNSDISVKKIKGPKRPIVPEDERGLILSNLVAVDFVTYFDEDTPLKIISELIPNCLVKGADWPIDKVAGKDIVEKNGGFVRTIEFSHNSSTSNIIETIFERYKPD